MLADVYFLLLWVNQPQPQLSVPGFSFCLTETASETRHFQTSRTRKLLMFEVSALLPFHFTMLVTAHIGETI